MGDSKLLPINYNVPIVQKDGTPTPYFLQWMRQFLDEKAITDAAAAGAVAQGAVLTELLSEMGGDPAANKLFYWDDTTNTFKFLGVGTNLAIAAGALNASGGGGGGGRTLISDQILAANAASVTFPAIPATFSDLILEMEARQTAAADLEYYAQFNGDVAANYFYYVENRFGTGNSGAATMARAGSAGSSAGGAGVYSPTISRIFGYSSTTRFKHGMGRGFYWSGLFEDRTHYGWRSNAAINSIKLLFSGAQQFAAGSRFRLYGET